jgi:hypothetical protein
MRAVIALCIGVAPFVLACEGVPNLRFASADDAASPPATDEDATIGAIDSSSGATIPDATIPADAEKADAHTVPQDSASPPPQSDSAPPPAGCPGNPPAGVTCCDSVACKGSAAQCNCTECAFCANEGFCCPSMHLMCATKLSDCP